MKVVTAAEMRSIDDRTILHYGISGAALMERAGLAVAVRVTELFDRGKVMVLSGAGNNGGDGFVVARNLFAWGWNVKVICMAGEKQLSPDCLAQYRTAKKTGVPVEFRRTVTDRDIHGAVVVDALLGTGINKPVRSPLSDVIAFLNASDVRVVSVDIPSGISSDNGAVQGAAVRADYTVTFGLPKVGHLCFPGAEYTGRLFIEDIGFPGELLRADSLKIQTVEQEDASLLVPERTRYSHKGDYGHVLLVAGSRGKTGAALMAAKACLRSGAGMITIGVPETLMHVFQQRATEEMILPLPDSGEGVLSETAAGTILEFLNRTGDVLAIGPGLTSGSAITRIMRSILLSATAPMVLDADAINAIAGTTDLWSQVKAPVILTPHTGEMARLMNTGSRAGHEKKTAAWNALKNSIEQDRIGAARRFSNMAGACLILKGVPTVIADPEGNVFLNTTGNPGMATAGSGDVLTGMVAAFLAQGMNPVHASLLGVYLHGLAGDCAASERGMHSLIASDVIDRIPGAFLRLVRDA